MIMTTPRERCQLCGCTMDAHDLPSHRRTIHEVLPAEHTVADVPIGRPNWLRPTSPADLAEHRLVTVGV